MAAYYQSAVANVSNQHIPFAQIETTLKLSYNFRVPICCLFAGPCLYVWLNYWSSVDIELYDQYKFGCICIAVSVIIELVTETPVFVAQVFCFIKLRVVLDTLHIFVRSILFIWFVLRDPNQAIIAFSIAQIGSTISFVIGYYGYFIYYIRNANRSVAIAKKASNGNRKESVDMSDDCIPFTSIKQMLPGFRFNSVEMLNHHVKWRPNLYIFSFSGFDFQ